MMSIRPVMHSLSYELGEIALAYNAAVDFHKKLAAFDMVDDPDLWGWGTFYRTSRSRAELAATAAQRSLDRAKLRRPQIDAVVICGASFPESTSDQARLCNDILSRLDLEHCFVIGASLLRCNSMLASIQVGAALVQSGMYRHALVIACDRVEDEAGRFQNFALFSDSSASCILSADNRAGYKLLSFATASNPKEMSREGEISGNLGRIATEETLLGTDIEPHNVSKVFPPNLLRPFSRNGKLVFRQSNCFSTIYRCDLIASLRTALSISGIVKNARHFLKEARSSCALASQAFDRFCFLKARQNQIWVPPPRRGRSPRLNPPLIRYVLHDAVRARTKEMDSDRTTRGNRRWPIKSQPSISPSSSSHLQYVL